MNAMLLLMTTRLTLSRGLNKLGHETMEVISDQNVYKLEATLSEALRRFQAFNMLYNFPKREVSGVSLCISVCLRASVMEDNYTGSKNQQHDHSCMVQRTRLQKCLTGRHENKHKNPQVIS